jgi:hypothetical protein
LDREADFVVLVVEPRSLEYGGAEGDRRLPDSRVDVRELRLHHRKLLFEFGLPQLPRGD